ISPGRPDSYDTGLPAPDFKAAEPHPERKSQYTLGLRWLKGSARFHEVVNEGNHEAEDQSANEDTSTASVAARADVEMADASTVTAKFSKKNNKTRALPLEITDDDPAGAQAGAGRG
ncbi:SWI/SNF and RSC complex subunit Ssr2, partial [Tilletia horrida]